MAKRRKKRSWRQMAGMLEKHTEQREADKRGARDRFARLAEEAERSKYFPNQPQWVKMRRPKKQGLGGLTVTLTLGKQRVEKLPMASFDNYKSKMDFPNNPEVLNKVNKFITDFTANQEGLMRMPRRKSLMIGDGGADYFMRELKKMQEQAWKEHSKAKKVEIKIPKVLKTETIFILFTKGNVRKLESYYKRALKAKDKGDLKEVRKWIKKIKQLPSIETKQGTWDSSALQGWFAPDTESGSFKRFLGKEMGKILGKGKNLELCAGSGGYIDATTYAAVDLSTEMLYRHPAPKRLHFDLDKILKGKKLPFKKAEFDSITIPFGYDYLKDPVKVLKHAKQFVKPGGKIMLIGGPTFHLQGYGVASKPTKRFFEPQEVKKVMEKAGLKPKIKKLATPISDPNKVYLVTATIPKKKKH